MGCAASMPLFNCSMHLDNASFSSSPDVVRFQTSFSGNQAPEQYCGSQALIFTNCWDTFSYDTVGIGVFAQAQLKKAATRMMDDLFMRL